MDEIIDYVMETPGNTNPNVLRGMLNNSGGNLPAVTSDDNGDVLTVVSGEWAKAAPSGGALLVEATFTEQAITLQKTAGELYAAYQVRPIVIRITPDLSNEFLCSVTVASLSSGLYVFSANVPEMGEVYFRALSADDYPIVEMQ